MRTMICALLISVAMDSRGQTETLFTNRDGSVYSATLTLGDLLNNNSPTNLSFTDLRGHSYSNALVTATNPASITLRWGGASGAKVDLTNAPDNIRSMFHYDASDAAYFLEKEESQKNSRSIGYSIASMRMAVAKERQDQIDSVKSTAHDVIGEVFQVTSGGALVNLIAGLNDAQAQALMEGRIKLDYSWDKTLVFLTNYGALLVDGEHLRMTTYPIGNYTYDSVNGSGKTVLRITPNLQTAIEYADKLRAQNFFRSDSEPSAFAGMKDGIPADVYDEIVAKEAKDFPGEYSIQVGQIRLEVEAYKKLHQ